MELRRSEDVDHLVHQEEDRFHPGMSGGNYGQALASGLRRLRGPVVLRSEESTTAWAGFPVFSQEKLGRTLSHPCRAELDTEMTQRNWDEKQGTVLKMSKDAACTEPCCQATNRSEGLRGWLDRCPVGWREVGGGLGPREVFSKHRRPWHWPPL